METVQYHTGDIITARVHKLPFLFHMGIIVTGLPVESQVQIYPLPPEQEPEPVFVWHNTPNNRNSAGGSVLKTLLSDWVKTRTVIRVVPSNLTKEYIDLTATAFDHRHFNWFTFNCEHFVYLIWTGEPRSPQLAFWSILAGTLAAVCLIRKKNRKGI